MFMFAVMSIAARNQPSLRSADVMQSCGSSHSCCVYKNGDQLVSQTLKEAREQRLKIAQKMRDLCEKVYSECRRFTAEEEQTWQNLNAEYTRLSESIERLKQVTAIQDELNQPDDVALHRTSSVRCQRDVNLKLAIASWARYRTRGEITPQGEAACRRAKINPASREITLRLLDNSELRALRVSPGTAGGFTVPTDFSYELEMALIQNSQVRRVARVFRTTSGADLHWPLADDTAAKAAIIGETASAPDTDFTFARVVLKAYKFATGLKVTYELLEDEAVNLADEIANILGERLARGTEEKYTIGSGTDEPQGVATGAHVGVTLDSQNAITADELIDLVHAVDPAYRRNGAFMMNDSVLTHIRKLKDTSGRYLIELVRGLDEDAPEQLLGYPVYVNRWMQSLGGPGRKVVLFGDFSRFLIRDVNEARLVHLTERFRADGDLDGFYLFFRTDSRLMDAGTHPIQCAITPE